MPDSDGVNTFFRIHNEYPLIPIIILPGSNDEEIGAYSVEKGARDFFVKGQTDGRLLECIMQCPFDVRKGLYESDLI